MKNAILKAVSIILALLTVFAIICAITVEGSGFLDLSNIARTVFIVIAVICGILATVSWICSKSKK